MLWFIAHFWGQRGTESDVPEAVLCRLRPPGLLQKQINVAYSGCCAHPSQLFINTDNDVLCVVALVNILPGAPAVLAVAVFTQSRPSWDEPKHVLSVTVHTHWRGAWPPAACCPWLEGLSLGEGAPTPEAPAPATDGTIDLHRLCGCVQMPLKPRFLSWTSSFMCESTPETGFCFCYLYLLLTSDAFDDALWCSPFLSSPSRAHLGLTSPPPCPPRSQSWSTPHPQWKQAWSGYPPWRWWIDG